MSTARQVMLVALGAVLIAALVIVWKYATGAMTLYIEGFWCTTVEQAQVCRFRGYQHYLIWTVIGIVNLLVVGLALDRFADRFRS